MIRLFIVTGATLVLAACSYSDVCCYPPLPTSAPIRATASPTAAASASPTQSPSNAPTATPSPTPSPSPSPSASPTPTPSPTPSPYGALTITGSPVEIDTVPGQGSFTVMESGPPGTIALAIACTGGAAASIAPQSAPVGNAATTIVVSASAAPNSTPPPQHACNVAVTTPDGKSANVPVDITAGSATIMTRHR